MSISYQVFEKFQREVIHDLMEINKNEIASRLRQQAAENILTGRWHVGIFARIAHAWRIVFNPQAILIQLDAEHKRLVDEWNAHAQERAARAAAARQVADMKHNGPALILPADMVNGNGKK